MSGGIAINAGFQAAELFGIAAITVYESGNLAEAAAVVAGILQPWRPPQWANAANSSAMPYCITVPGAYQTILGSSAGSGTVSGVTYNEGQGVFTMSAGIKAPIVPAQQPPTYLVFDGVMRANHSQPAQPTRFAVQAGSNISDHVLLSPARLSLDIIMSDAQQAYAAGQWIGSPSKSISCFMVLDALRAAKVPLTVSTRLKTYTTMILTDVVPEESARTVYGLRARVEFEQIFTASVSISPANSARPQTTGSTTNGPTGTQAVPSGVTTQNAVNAGAAESADGVTVSGAGNWSSNTVSGTGG